ncbi:MAG: hypothetical protein ACKO8C_06510, partial [Candidatus Nanopelagicaceae bacterium]
MKLRRLTVLAASLSAVVLIGNTLQSEVGDQTYAENYPPVICPVVGSGSATQISLNSSTKLVRPLFKKRVSLKKAKIEFSLVSNRVVLAFFKLTR